MDDHSIDSMVMIAGDEYERLRAENERLRDAIADYATFDTNAGRAMRLLQQKSNEVLTLRAEIERLRAALEKIECYEDREWITRSGEAPTEVQYLCSIARAALQQEMKR